MTRPRITHNVGEIDPSCFDASAEAIREFRENLRRDRALALANLRFQGTVLGVFDEPKLLSTVSVDGKSRHKVLTYCLDENGSKHSTISIATRTITNNESVDFNWIDKYTMAGYEFNLVWGYVAAMPETTAYYDKNARKWVKYTQDFGPYIAENHGVAQVGYWDPERLQGSEQRWTAKDVQVAQNIAGILGMFNSEDAVPFTLIPYLDNPVE